MGAEAASFGEANGIKADFSRIYTAPDPRDYYRVLFGLGYVIPEVAKSIFRGLVDHRSVAGRPLKVVDVGCSYGINAALLRHPIALRRLVERYASSQMQVLPPEELIALDRRYFASWPNLHDLTVVGQDTSAAAIDYATAVGLLDRGVSANLEEEPLDRAGQAAVAGADLVISTGCVGYVTSTTFRRILAAQPQGKVPWVANFVLRMFAYEGIAEELARFGLVTEKVPGATFVQRRFHSRAEFEATITRLRAAGIDPGGKESEGALHAELYVSRPPEAIAEVPIGELVSITSGTPAPDARRFVEIDGEPRLMH